METTQHTSSRSIAKLTELADLYEVELDIVPNPDGRTYQYGQIHLVTVTGAAGDVAEWSTDIAGQR